MSKEIINGFNKIPKHVLPVKAQSKNILDVLKLNVYVGLSSVTNVMLSGIKLTRVIKVTAYNKKKSQVLKLKLNQLILLSWSSNLCQSQELKRSIWAL